MGGDRKQYQVLVDPDALLEYDVTLQEVEAALKANNLNTSGGFVERGRRRDSRSACIGRLGPRPEQVVDDLDQGAGQGRRATRPVLLEHVARVVEGPAAQARRRQRRRPSRRRLHGRQAAARRHARRDRRGAGGAARGRSRRCPPTWSSTRPVPAQRDFIDRGIYNVGEALVIGAVLVLIILFLFLLNFRTTFITLTAIPLSLVDHDAGVPADRRAHRHANCRST